MLTIFFLQPPCFDDWIVRGLLTRLSVGVMVLGLISCSPGKVEQNHKNLAPIYSVPAYTADRDPSKDLMMSTKQAQSQQKRILLKVGGNWCSWCRTLDQFVHDNRTVRAALNRNFIIMKVNYSEKNPNEKFLSAYPAILEFPHFYVLDSNGELLHSQGTADLEQGQSYNEAAFLAFLRKWSPSAD